MHTKIRHPGAAYNKAVEQPGVSGAKNLAMTQHISYASFGPTPTFEPFKPRILTLGDTVEHCERCGGGIIVAINNNPWAPAANFMVESIPLLSSCLSGRVLNSERLSRAWATYSLLFWGS